MPTIRRLSFLEEWKDQLKKCHLIIIEDRKTKEVETPKQAFLTTTHSLVYFKKLRDAMIYWAGLF